MVGQRSSKAFMWVRFLPSPQYIMDSFWQIVYEDEYKEMKSLYPDIPEKDLWILILTKDNISYGGIQAVLGNPSKKEIKNTLKKYGLNRNTSN